MADITQHAKILIQSKGNPELMPFGDQVNKVTFTGVENGVIRSYHAFRFKDNSEVVDAIVVGEVLDADYDTIVKGEYTNYKIVQAYKDGQPVFAKGGGRKGGYGKSPEEQEAIARAVAFKGSIDLAVAGKVDPGDMGKHIIDQATVFMGFLSQTPVATTAPIEPLASVDPPKASAADLKAFTAFVKGNNIEPADVKATCLLLTGKDNAKDLTKAEVSTLIDKLTEGLTPDDIPF